jgi:hypothetical protein
MCGGFGLAFTLAAFFVPSTALEVTFLVLGVLCLVFSAFTVWREADKEAADLKEKLRPKLTFGTVGLHSLEHYRVKVRNLTQRAVRFKVRLIETKPPLPNYPLPVELQPTHSQGIETLGEVGPNDEHPVDVFIFGPLREVVRDPKTEQPAIRIVDPTNHVQLGVIGNPPLPYAIPPGTRIEIRLFVYPVSEPGEGEKKWFYIVPQRDGSVILTPDGGGKQGTPQEAGSSVMPPSTVGTSGQSGAG